jgi:polyferredoxin
MAKKIKMKKKSKIAERIEQMPPDEMAQRWVAMRPRYLKFLLFFVLAALVLYLANHFFPFEQTTLNIVNVAFQIFCVFVVLFMMLMGMSYIYGRSPNKRTA